MRYLLILFFLLISFTVCSKELVIKCSETTGTGRSDIFKIKNPEFYWFYNKKWYELSVSTKGVASDWKITFNKNKIKLFNHKMKWLREIDLDKMTAYMKFPTGEYYLYECKKIE